MKVARLLLVCLVLSGCVYYNGMYNARRLARSAEKAEREGRTFDASSYWGQAAVKAESVIVRHPDSDWVDDALLLRGQALERMGQCEAAVPTLEQAVLRLTDVEMREQALLVLGRCQLAMGNVAAAGSTFGFLVESADSTRRREARRHTARGLWMRGSYDRSLVVMEGAGDSATAGDRMVALAGAGRTAESIALADSLLARADTSAPWDSALAVLGRRDPQAASALVDRMRGLPSRGPTAYAQRLIDDARRLSRIDTALAVQRYADVMKTGDLPKPHAQARIGLTRMRLRTARAGAELRSAIDTLALVRAVGGLDGLVAASLARSAALVLAATDSVTSTTPAGDLQLFVGAEFARDSLRNDGLAGDLFRRIVDEWPASPYAPKALLAGRPLDASLALAADSLLAGPYSESPYLAVLRGDAPESWRQLEDSLGTFADARIRAARRPAAERADSARPADRPRRAPRPTSTLEDDLP